MLVSLWLNSSASSVIICVYVDVTDTVAKGKEGGAGVMGIRHLSLIYLYISIYATSISHILLNVAMGLADKKPMLDHYGINMMMDYILRRIASDF